MKNKKDLIIYSTIAVIIIVAVILVILYFTTDMFKSNQQLFYEYLAQTKIANSDFVTKYKTANNVLYENNNSSVMKVKVLNSKLNQETQISDIKELVNIESKGLKNILLNQTYRDFVFSNDNKTFLTLKYIKDNNTYGILADNILSKYLSVDNSNLKDLFLKIGLEDTNIIPDSISINYEELLNIDETILKELKDRYFTLIYENINKENFYKLNNEDKTRTIGISLSEQEFFNIIKLLLDMAKNDNTFLNLVVNKLQILNYNHVTIENIQSEIQKHIDTITNNTYLTDKDFIKLSLILRDKEVIKLIIENNFKEEIINYENAWDNGGPTSVVEYKNIFNLDFSEANKINITLKENDLKIINATINYFYDNDNIRINLEVALEENEEKNTLKLQYQTSNYQIDNINQACVIDIILQDESYQIDMSNDIVLKRDEVQISKLTTENSAKINDMTKDELNQLLIALTNRISELYGVDSINLYNNIRKNIS